MLSNPTLDKLNTMRFLGMAKAYQEQNLQPDINSLNFDERFALLVDREMLDRENRRLKTRLRKAKLRQTAAMEDIDYKQPRGLDKSLMLKLTDCCWVKEHHNILVVGPTGTGKTYLACALAHKACLQGLSSHYARVPRLLPELVVARGDGSFTKRINDLAKMMFDFSSLPKSERIQKKIDAEHFVRKLSWKNLRVHYFDAHELALKKKYGE